MIIINNHQANKQYSLFFSSPMKDFLKCNKIDSLSSKFLYLEYWNVKMDFDPVGFNQLKKC